MATDPNLRRVVAVKLIHPHLSGDPEFVRRFEEEAAAVARLRHPNIIQVYDFNQDGDVFFIVFEFVPGESLHVYQTRLAKSGRSMPLDQSLALGTNVADALAYAHERGIVHRDIKPANVMLNVQNEAILMDFGLVKIAGGDSHTATGAVMGTARYMSPEQIRGERVDERTDIYSLGIMLYEMTAGRPPFQADSALSLMMMHVNEPVPDLGEIRPDVPPAFIHVIEQALVKERENRLQSASELAEVLRSLKVDDADPAAVKAASAVAVAAMRSHDISSPAASHPPTQAPVSAPVPAQTPLPANQSTGPPPQTTSRRTIGIVGGIAVALLLILCVGAAAIIFGSGLLSSDDNGQQAGDGAPIVANQESTVEDATEEPPTMEPEVTAATILATETIPAPTALDTLEPTDEAAAQAAALPTAVPTAEPTVEPTIQPSPTQAPTPTPPAGPSAQITGITIAGGQYVVDY